MSLLRSGWSQHFYAKSLRDADESDKTRQNPLPARFGLGGKLAL
jgi:hypothetical protein